MIRPTTPAPDAASDDHIAAIERKALSLLAGTTPGRLDVHRCDADSGAIDYQLQRAPGTPATVLGYATDSDGSSRAKADATLWAHAHEMTTAVLSLAAEVRRITATLARLRAPAADVAAIGARAAAATTLPWVVDEAPSLCGHDVDRYHVIAAPKAAADVVALVPRVEGADADVAYLVLAANSVPALLALLAAEREGRAATERALTMIEAVASDAAEYVRYPGNVPPTPAQIPDALVRRTAMSVQRLAMKLRATIIERDNAVTALGHVGAGYDADIVAVWRALGREGDPPEDIDDVTEAIRDAVAERAAEVAGARVAALREAADACRNLSNVRDYGSREGMALACAAAVAALGAKGGA